MGRKEIGLQPSKTGMVGGKQTGQSVDHYIVPRGAYAKAYAKLKANGLKLRWQSAPQSEEEKTKNASKTKFTCHKCKQNAWAKPDASLICGNCYQDSANIVKMLPGFASALIGFLDCRDRWHSGRHNHGGKPGRSRSLVLPLFL